MAKVRTFREHRHLCPLALCGLILVQEMGQLVHAQNHKARENWSWDSTWVDAPKLQQSWAVTRPL